MSDDISTLKEAPDHHRTVLFLLDNLCDRNAKDDAGKLWNEKNNSLPEGIRKRLRGVIDSGKSESEIEYQMTALCEYVCDYGYQAPEEYFDIIEHRKSGAPDEYKFSPIKMAEGLMANEHFLVIGEERGERSHLYHAGDSVYRPHGENRIKSKIKTILREMAGIPSKQQVAEVIDKVRRSSIKWKNEIKDNVEDIPVLNGVLNWRTKKLREYDLDKDIFFCQIPVNYDPSAKCPNIEKFFDEIVEPDTRQSLIDIPAKALYRKPTKDHWGAIGEPDSSKTTYANTITAFVGPENKCEISIQRITSNPFAAAGLENKLINIYDDLGQRKVGNLGDWNAATGGGSIPFEKKGVDAKKGDPYAVHLYLANLMPRLDPNDPLDAFFRRMHIIRFPFVFKDNPTPGTNEKQRDGNLINILTKPEELSGLLNLVVDRMAEVVDHGPHVPKDARESMIEYMQSSDPFQAFVKEYCQLDRNMMTNKELMREVARWYSESYELLPIGDKSIKRAMTTSGIGEYQEPPKKKGEKRERYWRGIKIDPVIFEEDPVMFDDEMKMRFEKEIVATPKSQGKDLKSQADCSKTQDSQGKQSQLSQGFTTSMHGKEEVSTCIGGYRENAVIPVMPVIRANRIPLSKAIEMIETTFEIQRCDLSIDSLKELLPWVDIEGYEPELTRRGIWSKKPGPEGFILFHWEGVRA